MRKMSEEEMEKFTEELVEAGKKAEQAIVTKEDKFKKLLTIEEVANDTVLKEFCEHEIELLKNKRGKKSAKVIAEQEKIKADVLQILVDNARPMTVGEMAQTDIAIAGNYSSSKITSYLKKLRDEDKKVTRFMDKKVSYYQLAD